MKAKGMDAFQRKTIYGIGRELGICEPGNREDDLHLLVAGITGKGSVKELTYREAADVIQELKKRQGPYAPKPQKPAGEQGVPGMMTPGQKRKAWALMYSLIESGQEASKAMPGERLCAIIKKELHIDGIPKDPFRFLDYKAGNNLIEALKGYLKSEARKEGGGHGPVGQGADGPAGRGAEGPGGADRDGGV